MRTWPLALLLLFGTTLPCASRAQEKAFPSVGPSGDSVPGEHLVFAAPANFEKAYHSNRVGSMTEFVPRGESVEHWTEMLTVQIFHGLKAEPAAFLQTLGSKFVKGCPGFSSPRGIISGQANGYAVSMLTVKCPVNPATGNQKPRFSA